VVIHRFQIRTTPGNINQIDQHLSWISFSRGVDCRDSIRRIEIVLVSRGLLHDSVVGGLALTNQDVVLGALGNAALTPVRGAGAVG
jgi:hypothetical protein